MGLKAQPGGVDQLRQKKRLFLRDEIGLLHDLREVLLGEDGGLPLGKQPEGDGVVLPLGADAAVGRIPQGHAEHDPHDVLDRQGVGKHRVARQGLVVDQQLGQPAAPGEHDGEQGDQAQGAAHTEPNQNHPVAGQPTPERYFGHSGHCLLSR